MSRMVIAIFLFFMAYQLFTQLMATTRSIGQALYSVVYVTVPNSTVAQQIARYLFFFFAFLKVKFLFLQK
ncbi:unnamed protein product [Brugia timori]|uniref:Secreted protein n=1 Tax=Brugia timori TaxID=42155 RepID=A0A0R3QDT7_9BILA|nr:unnamed protein product [Brugia timori]